MILPQSTLMQMAPSYSSISDYLMYADYVIKFAIVALKGELELPGLHSVDEYWEQWLQDVAVADKKKGGKGAPKMAKSSDMSLKTRPLFFFAVNE